jgi:hypothetical protein
MLSEERTPEETTWSLGTYLPPAQVWEAFKLKGGPPAPRGVYSNQPDEYRPRAGALAMLYLRFAAILIVLGALRYVTASRAEIYAVPLTSFKVGTPADSLAYVTPSFDIRGRTANVEVTTEAEVENAWAYFDYALVNETTGTTYEFGREVSYYNGTDSDGSWSEGSRTDRTVLPSVPAGRYFLRVQPEAAPPTDIVWYKIRLRRDVPTLTPYLIALALLGLPPLFFAIRAWGMESARWKESDYAPEEDDSSDSDDD